MRDAPLERTDRMTLQFCSLLPPLQSYSRRLRLGLLTPHNPFDRGTFSGTPYFAARALEAREDIELHVLGSYRPPNSLDRLKSKLLRRRTAMPEPRLEELGGIADLDMVLGLVATPLLGRLAASHDVPYLHVTDATPAFLRDSYGWDVPADVDALEAQVARGATANVYSSDYMAERAEEELSLRERPLSIPFGINFDRVLETCPQKSVDGTVHLLFVCSDWQRKGGDLALAALDKLSAMGVCARLTIVGQAPEQCRANPQVTYLGYLDKNRPAEARKLAALYRAAHLLILPTRADCTPMVVAEAMAHGTPVLASNTGGMATLVAAGTGTLLDLAAGPRDWAEAIHWMIDDPVYYAKASQRAFKHAQTHLTWDAWAQDIRTLSETVLPRAIAA